MSDRGSLRDNLPRNSEGLTVAESWRKEAERLGQQARVLAAQARSKERAADAYLDLADKWDEEHGV